MITAYRPCKPSSDQGPSTVNAEQWNILETIDQKEENLREKMIEYVGMYIVQLIYTQHEVLLFIDANEPHVYCSSIDKLIRRTEIIDSIIVRHGSENEPNTHHRGSDRIYCALCIRLIDSFITKCGTTPFDQIS